jgi:acetyl esterase
MKLMLDKGVPPVNTLTAVEARESYRSRRAFTQPDAPEVFKTEDQVASYFDVNVPVRVYRPFSSQSQKSLPALVYIHGGGWTIGDLDTHDVLCRSLCLQADIVVISVDYRMGPEAPFPAAHDDCIAAAQFLKSTQYSAERIATTLRRGLLRCYLTVNDIAQPRENGPRGVSARTIARSPILCFAFFSQ